MTTLRGRPRTPPLRDPRQHPFAALLRFVYFIAVLLGFYLLGTWLI